MICFFLNKNKNTYAIRNRVAINDEKLSLKKKTGERESQEGQNTALCCVISKYKSANQSKVAVFFFAATSFTGRRYDGDGILTDERVDWNESS